MSAGLPEPMRRLLPLIWPLLAILAPLFVYTMLVGGVLDGLAPDRERIDALALTLDLGAPTTAPSEDAAPPVPVHARELTARLAFGLACLVFLVVAIASILYGAIAVGGRRGVWAGVMLLVVGFVVGLRVFVSDSGIAPEFAADGSLAWMAGLKSLFGGFSPAIQDGMRALIVTETREAAVAAGLVPATVDAQMIMLAAMVPAIGTAATAALVLRFAEIALWATEDEDEVDDLRARWTALRTTLLLGATVLTLATVGSREFYAWPVSMLSPAPAAALGPIANTGGALWGTLFTLLLVSTAVPAFLALHLEIEGKLDREAMDKPTRKAWRERHGLMLAPAQALSGVFAAATPLLATPALDALTTLFA
ncbi:MAG: hypothetical protein AAF698_02400 [Pseudomonadota bacterium]